MNAVETIKYNLDDQAFFGLFHTPEIKARRAERMRQDAMRGERRLRGAYEQGFSQGYANGVAHGESRASEEYAQRERGLIKAKDQEAASLAADVAGGFTMAATLVAIFMMV